MMLAEHFVDQMNCIRVLKSLGIDPEFVNSELSVPYIIKKLCVGTSIDETNSSRLIFMDTSAAIQQNNGRWIVENA